MSDLTSILLGKALKTREKQKLAFDPLKEYLDDSTEVFGARELAHRVADILMPTTEESDNPKEALDTHVSDHERLTAILYYTAIRYAPYWTYARRAKDSIEVNGKTVYPWQFASPVTWSLLADG